MTEATYTETVALRERLAELGEERAELIESQEELDGRIGAALLAVADTARVTMGEAAELLGMSRQNAYLIRREAEER